MQADRESLRPINPLQSVLSRRQGTPCPLWRSPVDPLKQHRHLAALIQILPSAGDGHAKRPFSNRLENRQAPWPSNQIAFSRSPPPPPKHKQMAQVRILLQDLLGQSRQPVEAFPRVGDAGSQPDTRIGRNRDHAVRPCASRTTRSGSKAPMSVSQWLDERATSTRLSLTTGSGSGGTVTSGPFTSTGRNTAASRPGPNRGSRRHLKTMFALRP